MTRVDFYILHDATERLLFASRVAEKAVKQRLKTYIHASNKQQAEAIDEMLWVNQEQSFVPHVLVEHPNVAQSPIVIGNDFEPGSEYELLINLADEMPLFFSRFPRMVEVIDRDEDVKRAGRERYKFYQDRGYPMDVHQIGN